MTARGAAMFAAGAGLVGWGWLAGWPELSALGAASVGLVTLMVVAAGPSPRVEVAMQRAELRVVRGQAAALRMSVRTRRPRWLRIVVGPPSAPTTSLPLGRRTSGSAAFDLKVPVDTSRRGVYPLGPYAIVHGDPWSIVRRVVTQAEAGVLTVLPRTVKVRRCAMPASEVGDSDYAGRRSGDQHFHALRDYVLGDEPRMVHWRSSARAGKLVVRQQVSAATTGTVVLLDVDATAYGSDEQFGAGWVADRFEAAVEVAASLVSSQTRSTETVHLATTRCGGSTLSAPAGSTGTLVEHLAAVEAVAPVVASPEEVAGKVRRLRAARVMLVTGTPGPRTIAAARSMMAAGARVAVMRVATTHRVPLQGVPVVDVDAAEDLR